MKLKSLSLRLRFDFMLSRNSLSFNNILKDKTFKIYNMNKNLFSDVNDNSINKMQISKEENMNLINKDVFNTKINDNDKDKNKNSANANNDKDNKEMIILRKYLSDLDVKIFTYLKNE